MKTAALSEQTQSQSKVPLWFMTIACVALLWNLLGLMAVGMNFMLSAEAVAQLSPDRQALYENTPVWSSLASLIAVITGTLGCIGLLIKRTWAKLLLIISVVALLIQDLAMIFITNVMSHVGSGILYTQGAVLLIAIALIWLAQIATKRKWLH